VVVHHPPVIVPQGAPVMVPQGAPAGQHAGARNGGAAGPSGSTHAGPAARIEPGPKIWSHFLQPHTQVIAIGSGKGGVGKSTVTVNLAAALAGRGRRVGVIDADVYGFSIATMLGAPGRAEAAGQVIMPLQRAGIKCISIGHFFDERQAIIWRGPQLHDAVTQFIGRVYWGDLEYLLIDLPPGTGDVPMTLAELVPAMGLVVVTTPQPAAAAVAFRAGEMARRLGMRLLGIVENMAYYQPSGESRVQFPFGRGGGRMLARRLGVPLLGRVPLDQRIREGGDAGWPVTLGAGQSPPAREFCEIAAAIVRQAAALRSAASSPVPGAVREAASSRGIR
jgi:ATP-binding protein involved in chromosome partitioning